MITWRQLTGLLCMPAGDCHICSVSKVEEGVPAACHVHHGGPRTEWMLEGTRSDEHCRLRTHSMPNHHMIHAPLARQCKEPTTQIQHQVDQDLLLMYKCLKTHTTNMTFKGAASH